MRKRLISILMLATFSTLAATPLDLSDFDEDAMQAVEDSQKELESAIPGRDVPTIVTHAEFIRDSLDWAAGYFDKKQVTDAVKLAHDGRQFAQQIATHASANEFAAAGEAFDSLKRTCKSCHNAYKPPDL